MSEKSVVLDTLEDFAPVSNTIGLLVSGLVAVGPCLLKIFRSDYISDSYAMGFFFAGFILLLINGCILVGSRYYYNRYYYNGSFEGLQLTLFIISVAALIAALIIAPINHTGYQAAMEQANTAVQDTVMPEYELTYKDALSQEECTEDVLVYTRESYSLSDGRHAFVFKTNPLTRNKIRSITVYDDQTCYIQFANQTETSGTGTIIKETGKSAAGKPDTTINLKDDLRKQFDDYDIDAPWYYFNL